jgi:uncharacterized protein (DUF1684 family)
MNGNEELADYRRSVAELYTEVRHSALDPVARWRKFCASRNVLFGGHPQSALSLEQRDRFTGLSYFPYNPALRFALPVDEDVAPEVIEVVLQEDEITRLQRFGRVRFQVEGQEVALSLFWIQGYGGGIFLPFRDQTNGSETYGGGRYLLDTIKGADLGQELGKIIIDFNYTYNPSCAYHPRWICPLAPEENRLRVPIPAGECVYKDYPQLEASE